MHAWLLLLLHVRVPSNRRAMLVARHVRIRLSISEESHAHIGHLVDAMAEKALRHVRSRFLKAKVRSACFALLTRSLAVRLTIDESAFESQRHGSQAYCILTREGFAGVGRACQGCYKSAPASHQDEGPAHDLRQRETTIPKFLRHDCLFNRVSHYC